MNTIQIEEESAIIPLKRLNEMKENERIFNDDLKSKCFAFSQADRYNHQSHKVYFIPSEWEIKRAFEEELIKKDEAYKYVYSKLNQAELKINLLEGEIRKFLEKKWYQFWL